MAELKNGDRDPMTHKAENGYYVALTENICQPMHVEGYLVPLIMLLCKQALTYGIGICIDKHVQSWGRLNVHLNIPHQTCLHLIACFQRNSL